MNIKKRKTKEDLILSLTVASLLLTPDNAAFAFRWDPIKDAKKIVNNVTNTASKAAQDTANAVQKAKDDTDRALVKAAQDTINAAQKAKQDTDRALIKGVENSGNALAKAMDDTGKEVVNLGVALAKFSERQALSEKKKWTDFEHRLVKGKIADAFAHLGIDQFRSDEMNAARAAQESMILRAAGQVVVTAYAGPGGAAAYAAWLTYSATKDASLALKAGLIAGATSYATGAAGTMSTATVSEVAAKAIVTGAIGGVAVAASGGDSQDVLEGFLIAGGSIAVQSGFKKLTTHNLDTSPSNGKTYIKLVTQADLDARLPNLPPAEAFIRDGAGKILFDEKGFARIDFTKLDPRYSHVGVWATSTDTRLHAENSRLMTTISRVPMMNTMAVFHDQWMVNWGTVPMPITVGTIPIAIAVTYMGTEAPTAQMLIKAIQQDRDEKAALSSSSPSPQPVVIAPTRHRRPDIAAPRLGKDGLSDLAFIQSHVKNKTVAADVKKKIDLLFLGDSVTSVTRVSEPTPRVVLEGQFERTFEAYPHASFSKSSDFTQHLLWRIEKGELDGLSPKVAVIHIGMNNLVSPFSAAEIATGITKVVHAVREKLPTTKILLVGMFPREKSALTSADVLNTKGRFVNAIISNLGDNKNVFFLDAGRLFQRADGTLIPGILKFDIGFYPSAYGLDVWAAALKQKVEEILN